MSQSVGESVAYRDATHLVNHSENGLKDTTLKHVVTRSIFTFGRFQHNAVLKVFMINFFGSVTLS